MTHKRKILLFLFPALSLVACAQDKKSYTSPEGYDFSKPVKYEMPDQLLEISGITFAPGSSDPLYAEQDEDGRIFYLSPEGRLVGDVKFGKGGDYEDITIWHGEVIILRSDGTLFSFSLEDVRNGEIQHAKEWKDLVPKGEYEGLYADHQTSQLFLLYKEPHEGKKKDGVSGYILQLKEKGDISPSGTFHIDTDDIARLSGKHHVDFKPSALAKNTRTNEWYILSSVNKMLVVADDQWKIQQVCALNSSLFIQPEGLAFDHKGALYISSEGKKHIPGMVFKFAYLGAR